MKEQGAMQHLVGTAHQEAGEHDDVFLGRLGKLSARLAMNADEIRQAQKIRHRVFCQELGAQVHSVRHQGNLEQDEHDDHCEHLLVCDHNAPANDAIVGTQRFYLRGPDHRRGNFYSQGEFDVEALASRYPSHIFMELGRSCILPDYRGKRTMELMWQGTWAYAVRNGVDVMIGCASFHADQATDISQELAFLANATGVTEDWSVPAIAENSITIASAEFDLAEGRKLLRRLPPLVKGYLRLGAMFSKEAVPDPEFGTIDVLVVLPVERISERYIKYYGEDASKHRA